MACQSDKAMVKLSSYGGAMSINNMHVCSTREFGSIAQTVSTEGPRMLGTTIRLKYKFTP